MNFIKELKPIYFWLTTLLLLVLFFTLPLKFIYQIKTPGQLLPARKWIMTKGTDGQLMTVLIDNKLGLSSNYSVSQFMRGDAANFSMSSKIYSGATININDTIAIIYSNENERQIVELYGDLEIAKASLNVNVSGEKESIIQEQAERLEFMKKQAEAQRKIYKRLESLYEKNLASQEEYEIAKGTADLNDINIAIAEAHLNSVKTGVKREMTEYINTRIQSLETELKTLKKRNNDYVILSKVAGVVTRVGSADTMLIVEDQNEFIMVLPIKWEERKYVKENSKIVIKTPSLLKNTEGEIFEINNTVKALNGSQVFVATAIMKNNIQDISSGLIVYSKILCDEVSPLEYLRRIIVATL